MMNEPDLVGVLINKSPQEKMHFAALKALIICEFFNNNRWMHRANPRVVVFREPCLNLIGQRG